MNAFIALEPVLQAAVEKFRGRCPRCFGTQAPVGCFRTLGVQESGAPVPKPPPSRMPDVPRQVPVPRMLGAQPLGGAGIPTSPVDPRGQAGIGVPCQVPPPQ